MTLTESCIAAAIIATTMTIAVPSLIRTRDAYTLQSAARDVASHMQSARITAISRNEDCRLTVTSGISYILECQEPTWQTIERIAMPKGITVIANNRPEFHRRGNVSPTATFTVTNGDRSTAIIVNVNGRVRLQ